MILTVTSEPKILQLSLSNFFSQEETLKKATTLMVTGQPDNRRILMLNCFIKKLLKKTDSRKQQNAN